MVYPFGRMRPPHHRTAGPVGKIVYSMLMPLDGFVETPKRQLDWLVPDQEVHRFINDPVRELSPSL